MTKMAFMPINKSYINQYYENMPMQYLEAICDLPSRQYREIFKVVKMKKNLIFAQNIDCGYTLEPPR